MTLFPNAGKSAKAIAASAMLLLASASFAAALSETTAATTAKAPMPGQQFAFDWRAGKSGTRKATPLPVSASISSGLNLGGGSYVCSPAGFGRQSSCFAR